ncbi:MAG: hypothetical protein JRE64_23070 [Deltaproteobacteria bacterium]|jgi:hypothetical protein|nr:hypothetical protein [Deltaproteobacteria bacterium]
MKAIQKALTYDIATEGLDEQGREKYPCIGWTVVSVMPESLSQTLQKKRTKGKKNE